MHSKINQILREFAAQPLGIQGVVLVSTQGQPLTEAIGLDYDSTLIMAGVMLQLAERTQEEFRWQDIQQISVHAEEGYIILISCSEEVFLLVKTVNAPSGFLERDINRTVKKLQIVLSTPEGAAVDYDADEFSELRQVLDDNSVGNAHKPKTKSQLEPDFIQYCQQELAEFIGPIATLVCQRTLLQNPQFLAGEFIKELAQKIPDSQQSLEFQRRVLSSTHWQKESILP